VAETRGSGQTSEIYGEIMGNWISKSGRGAFQNLCKAFHLVCEIICGLAYSLKMLNARKYTPYPIGSPHRKDDIGKWPEWAAESATVHIGTNDESVIKYKESSRVAFGFIDKIVARAQGLLQFNSIVFAGIVIFAGPSSSLNRLEIFILITSALSIIASTVFALCCLWIVWYRPEHHLDLKVESSFTWEIFCQRSLIFNISLLLAGWSFISVAVLIVFSFVGLLVK
jgi:hypothetical protein